MRNIALMACLLVACPGGTPNVAPLIQPAAACAVDIVEDLTKPPTMAQVQQTILDCGVSALDLASLIASLLANMPDAAGTITTGVPRGDYVAHLSQWKQAVSDFQAAQDGGQ